MNAEHVPSPARGGRSGWGRAGSGLERRHDLLQNAVSLGQDFVVPEPQHTKPPVCEKLAALPVCVTALSMLGAVNLDNQMRFEAGKVRDERPYRVLPSELEAVELPGTDARPKMAFGIRHLPAQHNGSLLGTAIAHAPILAFPHKWGKEHEQRHPRGFQQ